MSAAVEVRDSGPHTSSISLNWTTSPGATVSTGGCAFDQLRCSCDAWIVWHLHWLMAGSFRAGFEGRGSARDDVAAAAPAARIGHRIGFHVPAAVAPIGVDRPELAGDIADVEEEP